MKTNNSSSSGEHRFSLKKNYDLMNLILFKSISKSRSEINCLKMRIKINMSRRIMIQVIRF